MNSDEILVCQSAKAIIQANNSINLADIQVALLGDEAEVTMPALVISADLKNDEPGASLPKQYDLKTEFRWITQSFPAANGDALMEQITETLCPRGESAMNNPPPVITANFDYFRIEKQSGADFQQGQSKDLNTRSRTFEVFARLR